MRIQRDWHFQVHDDYFVAWRRGKSYWIDLNGRLTIREEKIPLVKQGKREWRNAQVYRNVERVAVTLRGTLCVGKHELSNNESYLTLHHYPKRENYITVPAIMGVNDAFEFPDGSRVQHNPHGMLKLISSLPTLPDIYVPCVLNEPLGVTTEAIFAGNPYYQMKRRRIVVFADAGEHRLKLVHSLVNLGVSLKDAKEAVLNRRLVVEQTEWIDAFCRELDALGMTDHIRYEGIEQQVISPAEFYKTYIQAFIDNIIGQHGT